MEDYVSNNLRKGEILIARVRISWLTLIPQTIYWIAVIFCASLATKDMENSGLFFLCVIAGAIPLVKRVLVNLTTHLAVTNKRLIGKVGIVRVNAIDYPIEKVDNISYRAGLWGNIFHYYTLEVRGGGDQGRKITGIVNALEFKNKVTDAVEVHAEEARKAQAAEIAAAMVNR